MLEKTMLREYLDENVDDFWFGEIPAKEFVDELVRTQEISHLGIEDRLIVLMEGPASSMDPSELEHEIESMINNAI